MFNEIVLVIVSKFTPKEGNHFDKNGKQNVFLQPVAGKIPDTAMVLSGTVAEAAGIEIGKTLLIMVNEKKPDPVYGRQFSHVKLHELDGSNILSSRKELGSPTVVNTGVSQDTGNVLVQNGATPNLNSSALPAETEPALVDN